MGCSERLGCLLEMCSKVAIRALRGVRGGLAPPRVPSAAAVGRLRSDSPRCETTVNFHIRNIVEKLQANGRTRAVTSGFRRSLLGHE